jgi:hypothetical protein
MPKWTIKVVNAEAKDFVQEVRTRLATAHYIGHRSRRVHGALCMSACVTGVLHML